MMRTATTSVGFGFISVVDDPVQGAYGGLLLLNPLGRPLELHCTVPVRINRAQEILYGRSLKSQLYGHTIAAALLQAASPPPWFVVTDCFEVLAYRPHTDFPMAFVAPDDGTPNPSQVWEGCRCVAASRYANDLSAMEAIWREQQPSVELMEPFQRLHEALVEMTGSSSAVAQAA